MEKPCGRGRPGGRGLPLGSCPLLPGQRRWRFLGGLALGGVVYPPVLWSIGKYGTDLPFAVKIVGALLFISGLGIGFYLFKHVYRF